MEKSLTFICDRCADRGILGAKHSKNFDGRWRTTCWECDSVFLEEILDEIGE